jgi:hypothetical protein
MEQFSDQESKAFRCNQLTEMACREYPSGARKIHPNSVRFPIAGYGTIGRIGRPAILGEALFVRTGSSRHTFIHFRQQVRRAMSAASLILTPTPCVWRQHEELKLSIFRLQ